MKILVGDMKPGQVAKYRCGCLLLYVCMERVPITGSKLAIFKIVEQCGKPCDYLHAGRSGIDIRLSALRELDFDPLTSELYEAFEAPCDAP